MNEGQENKQNTNTGSSVQNSPQSQTSTDRANVSNPSPQNTNASPIANNPPSTNQNSTSISSNQRQPSQETIQTPSSQPSNQPPSTPSQTPQTQHQQPQAGQQVAQAAQKPAPAVTQVVQSTSSGKGGGTKKIVLLILGILVLVAGAVGGYFLYQNFQTQESSVVESVPSFVNQPTTSPPSPSSPTSTPADQWNSYQSSALNISFQYPNGWILQESPLKLTGPDGSRMVTITGFNPTVAGIDYCTDNPEDTARCEKIATQDGTEVAIDWGATSDSPAIVLYSSSDQTQGISISYSATSDSAETTQLTEEDKIFFREFVSLVILPS